MDHLPGNAPAPAPAAVAPRIVAATVPSGGLRAVAIVEIIFGGLGLLGAPLTMAMRALAMDPSSRRVQEVMWTGAAGTWTRLSLGLSTVLAAALLTAGIGVLRLRPWARRLSLAWGAGAIALGILGQVMNALLVVPAMAEIARESSDPVARAGATGGLVGGIVGGLVGMALPIAVLVVMTRPGVKAQFAEG